MKQTWLNEKINKIDQSLAKLKESKREKSSGMKNSGMKGAALLLTLQKSRILREFYEWLYANTLDKLDEVDKFLERHNLLKQTQKEIEIWIGCSLLSTYTKIGTTQRRLAWPLHKDDTQVCETFHIFHIYSYGTALQLSIATFFSGVSCLWTKHVEDWDEYVFSSIL